MARITLIGAPVDDGQHRPGCRLGSAALRAGGLVDAFEERGHGVVDLGDVRPDPPRSIRHPNPAVHGLAEVHGWTTAIAAAIDALDGKALPIVLGGDHSLAAGTLPALNRRALRHGRKLFVLWLDAHPDFHTLDSTVSGNLHGVPLAYAAGCAGFEGYFPPNPAPIDPARICVIGARSVDAAEREALARAGIALPETAGGDHLSALRTFLDRVERDGGILHVSLDLDFLDPLMAPGVSTPAEGGPSRDEAFRMMRMLAESGLVASIDIAELNPLLDPECRTARLAVDLVATLLGRCRDALIHQEPPAMPAKRNVVPFVSVDNMMKLVLRIGIERFLVELAGVVETDFARWRQFSRTPRLATHSPQGVIELMPISDQTAYAFKYVNGHPKNMREGLQTVAAFGVLADVGTGYPVLLSEMTLLTALRTAATSAVAARRLAPANAATMAIIGNGAQAEFQALAFKALLGVRRLRLYDIDRSASVKCARNLRGLGFDTHICGSAEEAVLGAQIVTTATADKQCATILTDNMVGPGIHINALGGDCPGKTELHANILRRADIFVECAPQTRIEGEIQQLAPDHPVTELWEVLSGQAEGRRDARQITLFDSVGFAIEDFSALRYVKAHVDRTGLFEELDMVADPDEPRDLFGMLLRAQVAKSAA